MPDAAKAKSLRWRDVSPLTELSVVIKSNRQLTSEQFSTTCTAGCTYSSVGRRGLSLEGTAHQGGGYTANLNLGFHFYREEPLIIS